MQSICASCSERVELAFSATVRKRVCSFTVVSPGWSLSPLPVPILCCSSLSVCSRSVGVSLGHFDCTRGLDFSRIRFAGVYSPRFSNSSFASFGLVSVCDVCHWCANCGTGRGCLSVLLYCSACTVCHAFGLWDCPGLPLLLSAQICDAVFLASWACACRASCGLAHLISEISCVRVPTDHWPVSRIRTSAWVSRPAVPKVCLSCS